MDSTRSSANNYIFISLPSLSLSYLCSFFPALLHWLKLASGLEKIIRIMSEEHRLLQTPLHHAGILLTQDFQRCPKTEGTWSLSGIREHGLERGQRRERGKLERERPRRRGCLHQHIHKVRLRKWFSLNSFLNNYIKTLLQTP